MTTPIHQAAREDDVDRVRAWLDAGGSPDAKIPAAGHDPLLAIAYGGGAHRVVALLRERGARVDADVLAKVAAYPTADALTTVLALVPRWDPAALARAFCSAHTARRRDALIALAARITDWSFSVHARLPPLAGFAEHGLWMALERIDDVDVRLRAPLAPALIASLRQSNLVLRDGADCVDLALARLRSLETMVADDRKRGDPTPAHSLGALDLLTECRAWFDRRGLLPAAAKPGRRPPRAR